MGRVCDLVSLLTASGVAIGRSNGCITVANVPAILQTCQVTLNIFAPARVAECCDNLLIEDSEALNYQILPVLGIQFPGIAIAATYIAAPSLVPVPPT